jgi:hypothetical protein
MHDFAQSDCNSYSPNPKTLNELLELLRFGSTASPGYFTPPVTEEEPMPERVFRRRRTSANADF